MATPVDVIEQVKRMRERFGEHEPSIQVTFGGIGDAEALRTVDLSAHCIMPVFGASAKHGKAPRRPSAI